MSLLPIVFPLTCKHQENINENKGESKKSEIDNAR